MKAKDSQLDENMNQKKKRSKSKRKCTFIDILLRVSMLFGVVFVLFVMYAMIFIFEDDIKSKELTRVLDKDDQTARFAGVFLQVCVCFLNRSYYSAVDFSMLAEIVEGGVGREEKHRKPVRVLNASELRKEVNLAGFMKYLKAKSFSTSDNDSLLDHIKMIDPISDIDLEHNTHTSRQLVIKVTIPSTLQAIFKNYNLQILLFFQEFSEKDSVLSRNKLQSSVNHYPIKLNSSLNTIDYLSFSNVSIVTHEDNFFPLFRNYKYTFLKLTGIDNEKKQRLDNQPYEYKIVLKPSSLKFELDLRYSTMTILKVYCFYVFVLIVAVLFIGYSDRLNLSTLILRLKES